MLSQKTVAKLMTGSSAKMARLLNFLRSRGLRFECKNKAEFREGGPVLTDGTNHYAISASGIVEFSAAHHPNAQVWDWTLPSWAEKIRELV